MNSQGDAYINRLISQYKEQKNYAKVDESYKTLIDIARKANNAGLVARTYDKYILWSDSVKALTAQDELNVLKQKKAIQIANEHNELKTKFIQNISSQMEPTLNTLDTTLPGVRALKGFAEHIQELSDLESTLSEAYEMREININTFCESVMDKIKSGLKPDIATAVNAPKLSVKTNPEQLERILLHLLNNAAEFTPEGGKIWLDFKKRGAHTHQFIVSDTGSGIAEEEQADLFKPFTKVKDLTEGDGLGLPICSLIATKMNGSLTLDSSYTKGCRFVLELHT